MKLGARIFFKAAYGRTGRPDVTSTFYEPIEIDIPELTPGDAPVATRIDREIGTRWHSGRHFARFRNPDALTLTDLRTIMEWNPVSGLSEGYDCFRYEVRSSLFPPIGDTVADDSGREAAVSMAASCFDRIVMIDGEFWIACDEPYLYRETVEHPAEPSVSIPSRQHPGRPYHRSHAWLFHSRVSRADDPVASPRISVEIPESIVRQPERDAVVDAARWLIEDYSFVYLADKHPEIIARLAALHAAIHGLEPAEIDCDTVAVLIEDMAEAMSRREREPRLSSPGRIAAYRNCAERWNDRCISASDTLGLPPRQPRL